MIAAETETVADMAAPAALAAAEARSAYADLLQSLHAVIHFADAPTDAVAESLARLTQAWAAHLLANDGHSSEMPLTRPAEQDVIRTLLSIARYSRPDDAMLAELAESFRGAVSVS